MTFGGFLPIRLAEIVAHIGRHCLAVAARFHHVHAAVLTRLIVAALLLLFLVLIVELVLVLLAAAACNQNDDYNDECAAWEIKLRTCQKR